MKVNLDHVIAFWAVASEGSFTKGAAALNSCQSRMSAKVKALEQRLEVQLFTRSTRFVELTSSGQLLLAHADQLATSVARIEAVAETLRRSGERVLRFGAPGCTATTRVRGMLTDAFEQRYSNVRLDIEEGMPMTLLERLCRHQIDVAIIPGPLQVEELDTLKLHTIENKLVIPDNHVLARLDAVPVERLMGQQIVCSPREAHPALFDEIVAPLIRKGATIVTCPETYAIARMRYAKARGMITWCQGFEDLNVDEHGFVLRDIVGLQSQMHLLLVRRNDCDSRHVDAFWSCAEHLTSHRDKFRRAG